jgi:hypothetical protein
MTEKSNPRTRLAVCWLAGGAVSLLKTMVPWIGEMSPIAAQMPSVSVINLLAGFMMESLVLRYVVLYHPSVALWLSGYGTGWIMVCFLMYEGLSRQQESRHTIAGRFD